MPYDPKGPRLGLPASATPPEALSIGGAAALLELAVPVDNRQRLVVNPTDGDIFIGTDNTVTTANGLLLASGSWLELDGRAAWWAISAGAVDVRVYAVEG
jgi:hypothetical protein